MAMIRELADQLWRGEIRTGDFLRYAARSGGFLHHEKMALGREEYQDGLMFFALAGNVVGLDTADGLVLVDTGGFFNAQDVHDRIREWSDRPLHTAIYTHGHADHVFGVPPFEAEDGAPRARVVAHEALPARFDRYRLTAGHNTAINRRQFRTADLQWPTRYRYPDVTYSDTLALEVGGERLELHHCRGETDDATWVWLPARRVLCTGDLFIWAAPNAGNPQKVQRYVREWAAGLETMAALEPELLLPGHGLPIEGADRVRQALTETAELLHHLHDRTVALMNEGARLDRIVQEVRVPEHLRERPYLQPVYDEPEFVVRNLWRLYGGWYDGNPAHLKPAPEAQLAVELAALTGGATRLAARATELSDAGEHRLACHLAELAYQAAPADAAVRAARAAVYHARSEIETSVMAIGVYCDVAGEMEDE